MKVFHLVGSAPYYTNSFLLVTAEKQGIVIDPAADAKRYQELLAQEAASLTHILCTHGHFDHVYTFDELYKQYNPTVYLDPADAKGNERYPICIKTEKYTDGGAVRVGEAVLQTWHTPGHTQGSWLIACAGLLFAGDTLFQNSVGRTDLEGGDSRQQAESMRRIRALPLPPDTQVLPGHGSFTTLGAELENNPFLAF